MDVQPTTTAAPAAKIMRREGYAGEGVRVQASSSSSSNHGTSSASSYMPSQSHVYPQSQEILFGNGEYGEVFQDLNHPRPPDSHHYDDTHPRPPDFEAFDLDHELLLPDTGQHLDISEFLLSDLDRSSQHQTLDSNGRIGEEGGSGGVHGNGGAGGIGEHNGGRGIGHVREAVEDDSGGGGGGGGCCCR